MSKRLLVIFGLRGCLLERASFRDPLPAGVPPAHYIAGAGRLWVRPKAIEVLEHLHTYCDLAIWSSTTPRNTKSMSEVALKDLKAPLRFVWSRDKTVPDDCRRQMTSSRDDAYATMKDLRHVQKDLPSEFPRERIVLVDDSPSKSRCNADNLLWLPTYDLQQWDDERPMLALKDFFDHHLRDADDVRKILPQKIFLTSPPGSPAAAAATATAAAS